MNRRSLLALACLLSAPIFALDSAAEPHPSHLCFEHWPKASDGPAADSAEPEPEKKDEAPKWDVTKPGFAIKDIEIDVTEGTWLNLDVSPDGKEIVFDLLGDLYSLPIAGGEAKALTSGMAWDMQPRFSPDGKSISFTSDRSGGDNVWTMTRTQDQASWEEAKQVTKESFRLVNNAVWSPDGQYLAARKHFTGRRSLGAGEIWLYHRSGGDGVQLTVKPNDQKDLGEPAFSPDGRYLYYSRDATQGATFAYNKDPNDQIYTIERLDLREGTIETQISGPGGAIRPTPSPDGKKLAFVRRAQYKTALFVRDLVSDLDVKLWDLLDRDLQETWAIHGVYANFAWTPDNKALVVWAGGKLHRIEVASGARREIPFRVRQKHQVAATAARFKVEVAPENFDAKMIRWPQVSPDGKQVVFQALGYLYLKDLPNGAPKRLTSQTEAFELHPSWSRDGQSIVYTTWNDDKLGAVKVLGPRTAYAKTLTKDPGHYAEPVFSPDGKSVVYRKSSGGFLTSPSFGRETGLYAVSANGGAVLRISEEGRLPHFGNDSERVFFLAAEPEDRRSLRSVGLDGKDPRSHVTSEAATEFRVSPSGRWLAFRERFNAYLMALPPTGKTFEIGPKATNLPVKKVSRDVGNFLHWSGDGSTLFWSSGDQLFSRKVQDAFAFLDGAPETLPEPPEQGVKIGFKAKADKSAGKTALVGARLVTMKGDEIIEDGTILIEGDRIKALGPRVEVKLAKDVKVVDVAGKTIIPGLVDVHWHGAQGTDDDIVPQQNWYNFSSLAFGVTTIHDPSTDTSAFFAAAELARTGAIVAPRLFSTGTILYGAAGDFKANVDSLDDARSHLRRMKDAGAISVKSYNQPRRDQRQQILQAARELDMMVVPEGGSLFMHNMTMVVDGHTGIEHAIPLATLYDDVVQLWSQTEVGYTPTLVVAYGGIWGENYWYANTDVWANERLMTFVPRFAVDPVARRPFKAPLEEYNHFAVAKQCRKLADRGVKVNIGAHGQREGLGAHWELWMLEQGGMTAHEALRAATLNGAHYVGLDADIGSLEAGKLADLVVLDKNPLENLRDSEQISWVMVGGRLFDARTLDEVGNRLQKRKPFFFEAPTKKPSSAAP